MTSKPTVGTGNGLQIRARWLAVTLAVIAACANAREESPVDPARHLQALEQDAAEQQPAGDDGDEYLRQDCWSPAAPRSLWLNLVRWPASSYLGVSTELDWVRVYWDVHTNGGG